MKIAYEKRKSLYGYGFIALWLVGTVLFFIVPLIKSFTYSFLGYWRETFSAALSDWIITSRLFSETRYMPRDWFLF